MDLEKRSMVFNFNEERKRQSSMPKLLATMKSAFKRTLVKGNAQSYLL